jgi:hypothetical protein
MSKFAPHLTLDLITEVCTYLHKLHIPARLSQLQALSPWVQNLIFYTDPTHELYEVSGARLREAVRYLVDLTTGDQEVCPSVLYSHHALIVSLALSYGSTVRMD